MMTMVVMMTMMTFSSFTWSLKKKDLSAEEVRLFGLVVSSLNPFLGGGMQRLICLIISGSSLLVTD